MLDGGMFSDLELYKKRKFFQQHKYVRFDTLDELGLYEVMAVVITTAYQSDSFQYYNYIENNELTFNTYVQECKQRALYDTGMDAEYGDKLVTLSTCEYSNDNGRLIVVAKRLEGLKKWQTQKIPIIIICFILVILLGAGAAAYPLIASINNEHTQSLVQTEYEEKHSAA